MQGVLNGSSKNVGLGKFWTDLEIVISQLGVSIFFKILVLFWVSQSRKVSDLPFYTPSAYF